MSTVAAKINKNGKKRARFFPFYFSKMLFAVQKASSILHFALKTMFAPTICLPLHKGAYITIAFDST